MIEHWNIQVYGNVQGVSYRYYTQLQAQQLGIKGNVRNRPDGSVYIEAESSPEILEQLVAWCHQGSPMASVEQVKVQKKQETDRYSSFNVVY